ncbi:hypothetical protein MTBPR1_190001 [Candidatus Terasakiella magnetica]|uniref:Uncharacterized protein n=1 Tax=Candidatus Terasakiella magnetica TaxID=1867952 RepID=A0A1C3RFP9_9PROT|nr:hypothetical protein [Candidatus Terasakiella magnetica]SCA56123.1 hypothetical protein MTBPR1_190001 [Candidatus Terasakiella magnetica]
MKEEVPEAIDNSTYGVKQVAKTVLAMKEFSHPSTKEKSNVNLNQVIERVLIICKNEWKNIAELELKLAPLYLGFLHMKVISVRLFLTLL